MSGERRRELSARWTIETQQEAEVDFHPNLAAEILEIINAELWRRGTLLRKLAPVHPTEVFPRA
jgi:ribosomal protein S7